MSATPNAEKIIDRVLIWRCRKANPELSIPALAQLVRKPIPTVRRAVKLLEVPPKEILESYEHDAVNAWVAAVPIASAKGDHRPAKDLLLHSRAIDPVQLQGQTQIAIIFTTSTVPGLIPSPARSDANKLIPSILDVPSATVTDTRPISTSPEPEDRQGPQSSSG